MLQSTRTAELPACYCCSSHTPPLLQLMKLVVMLLWALLNVLFLDMPRKEKKTHALGQWLHNKAAHTATLTMQAPDSPTGQSAQHQTASPVNPPSIVTHNAKVATAADCHCRRG